MLHKMRNKHLLNLYYMSGTMLGSRNTNIQRNPQYTDKEALRQTLSIKCSENCEGL